MQQNTNASYALGSHGADCGASSHQALNSWCAKMVKTLLSWLGSVTSNISRPTKFHGTPHAAWQCISIMHYINFFLCIATKRIVLDEYSLWFHRISSKTILGTALISTSTEERCKRHLRNHARVHCMWGPIQHIEHLANKSALGRTTH